MKRRLFFCTSMLNVLYFKNLKSNENEDWVITKKDFLKYFDDDKILMVIPDRGDKSIYKILTVLKSALYKMEKYDEVYVSYPNIYSQIIIKKNFYKELIYFDDGVTFLENFSGESIVEKIYKRKSIKNYILKIIRKLFLLEQPKSMIPLNNARLSKCYLFLPETFKNKFHNLVIKDAQEILTKKNIFNIEVPEHLINPDYIILTQNLTSAGLVQDNEEVRAIEKFIDEDIKENERIVIKLHPRDEKSRYQELLTRKKNVYLVEENMIPYEVYHSIINPKNIVSFGSIVLFNSSKTNENFKRISLINLLHENKEILNIKRKIEEYSKYNDEIKIV